MVLSSQESDMLSNGPLTTAGYFYVQRTML
jgi:hypothetical protein